MIFVDAMRLSGADGLGLRVPEVLVFWILESRLFLKCIVSLTGSMPLILGF